MPALPVTSLRLSRPCGKVTPGGREGEPDKLPVETNPEFAASTTQPLVASTTARPVPLLVAVDALGAEQDAVLPPPEPVHDQVQGEPLATALGVPLVHRPELGAKAVAATVPQAPLTAGDAYVNSVLAALVPPAVVTSTLAVPTLPEGVVQVAVVALVTLTLVHATPPTVMPVAPVRLVPVMVIGVPPAVEPLVGDTPVTVGAGGGAT